MYATAEEFREFSWNSTKFHVLQKTEAELIIVFEDLALPTEPPKAIEMKFINPFNEWASLWNPTLNEWVEHTDNVHPIGDEVVEATAKQVRKIKFSFGGNHSLGWARWGFSADAFQIRER